jgi:hypothetical protein
MTKTLVTTLATTLSFFGLGVAPPGVAHAAPLLQAYALSAGGSSAFGSQGPFSCATFGRDPLAKGVGGGFEVGLPIQSGCGVGVDNRAASATSGALSVSSSLGVTFGQPTDPRVFIGNSTGRAGFGNLGVRANASYSGTSDSSVVSGAQAFGIQTEEMTFGGATGSGFYRPTFTIDGSLFNVGRTENQLAFSYAVDNGPAFLAFRIQDSRGTISLYGPNGYVTAFPGFSVTGALGTGFTVAGSTTITLNIPIVFGTATDLTYSLWGASLPSSSFGQLTPSTGEVEFLSTVKLTGIELFDAAGFALENFTIVAGSGTQYDRNGVVGITDPGGPNGVPEPGTLPLLALAIFALGWLRKSGTLRATA